MRARVGFPTAIIELAHPNKTRHAPHRRGGNEEMVIGEMGQVGTRFDGISHQTIGDSVLENLKLDQLVSTGASEFALVLQPMKLTGATGSTVAPVAIR